LPTQGKCAPEAKDGEGVELRLLLPERCKILSNMIVLAKLQKGRNSVRAEAASICAVQRCSMTMNKRARPAKAARGGKTSPPHQSLYDAWPETHDSAASEINRRAKRNGYAKKQLPTFVHS
jgi:hypothetical protein